MKTKPTTPSNPPLTLFNTLTRTKQKFVPLNPPHVGMYVCGPTVYGDAHLGHARPAITFDLLFRYLKHKGYKVRYVRNITDVGHLENDEDHGEDKIGKKARLEQLEPMEVVQHFVNRYHENMRLLNVLPPSIEPTASGHVIEQQVMVRKILESGYAYESGGSVYFDVEKYSLDHNYGKLSGRKVEDLLTNTRSLEGQDEKKTPMDFAIWKKADAMHIMRWPSEWGEGFPGWHLECSAMSEKYLGKHFDIHGGGMDLLFPHHECEIAQTVAANGEESVRYWMHNNMITINGQKMGKSLGNFITLDELFSGSHKMLEKAYSPMTIRFFILQAHYRSTLDFSNEALQASEKGFQRLAEALENLGRITPSDSSTVNIDTIKDSFYEAMDDDLNSPIAIAALFEAVKMINLLREGREQITAADLEGLMEMMNLFVKNILGLIPETRESGSGLSEGLIEAILQLRKEARERKDFGMSDRLRDELMKLGVEIKDGKGGVEWRIKG